MNRCSFVAPIRVEHWALSVCLSVCLSVRTNPVPQIIYVGSSQLEVVREFTYLGACTMPTTAAASPKFFDGQLGSLGIAWHYWRSIYGSHISGSRQRLGCTASMFSQCCCMVLKSGQSLRMLLTRGLSLKSFGFRIPSTSPTLLSGRLPAVLQFPTVSERERERERETAPLLRACGKCGP